MLRFTVTFENMPENLAEVAEQFGFRFRPSSSRETGQARQRCLIFDLTAEEAPEFRAKIAHIGQIVNLEEGIVPDDPFRRPVPIAEPAQPEPEPVPTSAGPVSF